MDDVVDASVDEYEYGEDWTASCRPGGTVPLLPDGESDSNEAWGLNNVGDNFDRRMTIDYGLYYSVNTATIASAYDSDLCAIDETMDKMGIKFARGRGENEENFDVDFVGTPSALLGTAELSPMTIASAYATFANDGVRCEPRALLSITDQNGEEYSVPGENCDEVIDRDVVAQVNDTLINIAEYQAADGNPPFPMLGKTGTASYSTHTYFAGSTKGLTTVAFVGRPDDNQPQINPTINNVTYSDGFYGSSLAMPTWYDYMTEVAGNYDTGDFRSSSDSPFDNRRDYRYNSGDATGPGSSNNSNNDDDDDDD